MQFRSVEKLLNHLTNTSVPVFAKAEELERSQKNLLLQMQRAENTADPGELFLISQDVATQLSDLRTQVLDFPSEGTSALWAAKMELELTKVESSSVEVLESKKTLLEFGMTLDTLVKGLRSSRETTRTLLEDLAFETTTNGDSVSETITELDDETVQQHLAELALAHTITAITLEIDAVTELGASLRNIQNLGALKQAENTLRFKFRGLAVLLGRVQESPIRTKLASEVLAMRSNIFADTGILYNVAQLLKFQDQRADLQRQQSDPIQEISTLSRRISEAANNQVIDARQKLNLATQKMITVLVISEILALLAISWTIVFVVEKQINQRIAKLTKAVLKIAAGETSYKVDVIGNDELGRMASALGIFKLNAQELLRSNGELEKFAYVAAHDLRSPLRGIQDLAEWTIEDPDTVFSEDGKENMQLLQKRVERLNRLLSDLLEYSRVGKDEDSLSVVSVADIVTETKEMLDPENRFNIRYIGFTEPILTYTIPLRQIILNLVNNAIKHHDRSNGYIEILAEYRTEHVVFTVSDDGAGIEPKYHQRIFELFQTLKSRDEVEGSGLGLAIIQKLLDHHGGSIVVESDPSVSRGTCFTFTLPEKSQEQIKSKQAA